MTFGANNRCITIKTKKEMKKNLFLVAAVASIMLTACVKEEYNVSENAPVGTIEFTASFDAETKTTLNNGKTEWLKGDEISINGVKFTATASGTSVKFTNAETPQGEFKAPFTAVYPYSQNLNFADGSVSGVLLNPNQTAKASSFADGSVPEIAYTETNQLSFKNACSVVKFKFSKTGVTKVEISSNNGEDLAGTVKLAYNDGIPLTELESNGSSTVTLTGNFDTTSEYYVAVLASGLENGISVRVNGSLFKTVATQLQLNRNTIVNVGTLSLVDVSPQDSKKWFLKGDWEGWTGIPMYYESGLFVARDVPMNGGFKINSSTGDWIGGSTLLATDSWHTINNGDNMTLKSYSGNYDVYFSADNNKLYITQAGKPAPSVWGVWVNGVSNDYPMIQVGQYFVAKSVSLNANTAFKFRTFSDWATNKGYGTVVKNIAYSLNSNGSDMKIDTAGNYDIYLTTNAAYGFIVEAGHSLNDNDIKLEKMDINGCINGTTWTANSLYVSGDYFALKGQNIKGAFLFRVTDWSTKWGLGKYAGKNKKSTLSAGGGDITGANADNVDIYVNHDFSHFWVMDAGKIPEN